MVDDNTIFETIGGACAAGFSWFMLMIRGDANFAKNAVAALEKSTNQKIGDLALNLKDYQILMANTVPTKSEMNAAILETKDSVKRINDRLDEILGKIK